MLLSLGGVRPSRRSGRGDRGVVGGTESHCIRVEGKVGVAGSANGVVGGCKESGIGRVTPRAVAYCAREF